MHTKLTPLPLLALAVAVLGFGCAEPPMSEIKAAESAVNLARIVGAPKHAPTEFSALEKSLQAMYHELKRQERKFALSRDYAQVEKMAKAIRLNARRVAVLAWEKRMGKQSPPKKERTLFGNFEGYQNELLILLIGSIVGGTLVGFLKKRRKRMEPRRTSLPATISRAPKTSATDVDLDYHKAQTAAVKWSTARKDRKDQERLRVLVKERTQTGQALKEATEQEAEIAEAENRLNLARGKYHRLPPLEQADVECKIAEKEAQFNESRVRTAEAQRKIRKGEAFKRAVVWQQWARQDRNILDPQYRERFAKTNHAHILGALKEKWTGMWEEVMNDAELVAYLYKSSPEVLDWFEAHQETIRLAERFAATPPDGGA